MCANGKLVNERPISSEGKDWRGFAVLQSWPGVGEKTGSDGRDGVLIPQLELRRVPTATVYVSARSSLEENESEAQV